MTAAIHLIQQFTGKECHESSTANITGDSSARS